MKNKVCVKDDILSEERF